MDPLELDGELKPIARTQQIVLAALLMGVLAFTVVVVFLRPPWQVNAQAAGLGTITLAAIAFAFAGLTAGTVAPTAIANAARRRTAQGTWSLPQNAQTQKGVLDAIERHGDAGKLLMVYQTFMNRFPSEVSL